MRIKILLLAAFISFFIGSSFSQNYQFNSLGNGSTTTTCKGTFTASGAYQASGAYSNNANKTVTFCSGTPGVPIRISFINWSLESGFDFLRVYDGTGTGGTLLGTINGVSDIFTIGATFFTSTGTCLTVQLISDGSVTGFWNAIIGCQPQNCGTNLPANDFCGSAPQICDLNGYCGNTSGWYTRDNGQIDNAVGNGQFCGSIENNSWLTFVASAATATLNINSFNCAVTTTGIQARVYETNNCSNFTIKSNCVSQGGAGNGGASGAFTLTATGLTVGTRYYVMIDGFAGNICDYTVTANTGVQVLSFTSTASANQICEGGTASISINGAISGSTYSWTASPPGSITGPTNGATINVNPTVTTVYSVVVTQPNGCLEQTESFTLTVNPKKTTTIDRIICSGQSVNICGTNYNTPGTFVKVCTTSKGCDSTVTLNLTVQSAITTNLPDRIFCQGASTTFNGNTITTSGTYRDTLLTLAGCDSFLVLNVIVNPVRTTPISRSICQGQSTTFNGQTITQAGTFRDTLSTSAGCDSFIVLTVTLNPTPTTPISRSICQGQSTTFNGQTITQAGTFRDTLSTSAGCDSFIVLTVTLNPTPTTPISRSICQGQSTTFNGQTITQAGTFRDTLSTSAGCDSFIVLTVTLNPTPTTPISRSICQGQSTTFNGQTITQAGTFRDTLSTSAGCDSFIVLTVTLNPTPTTPISRSICQGQSTTFNGQTITQAGTFRDTLSTSAGCDSFIVLTVTLNPTPTTPISRSICQGQSTTFNGQTITQAGTFRDTLSTSAGCDSFIVLTVTLNPTPTTPISRSICQGQSTTFNGQIITQAGTFRDTLSTSAGCDSFIVLTVILNPTPTTPISRSICQGQSTTFNGQTITQAGTFRDTLSTSAGCDSFIVLTVILNPTPTTPISRSICQGQSTTFNGQTITQAGTFRDTLSTSAGCDSFIVLTVILNPTPTTPISRSICQGQSTTFNGQTITQAGIYRDTLSTSLGCDSFIVLTLTTRPTPTTNISQQLCNGQSIVFNGLTITLAGTYRDTLSTTLSCDSFIVLTVTVVPFKTTPITQSLCVGQSTTFNGQTITQGGIYRDTLLTSLGCDSFIVLTVIINPTPTTPISRSICQGQSTTFNGQTITQAGTFRDTLSTSAGCDSFIVLTVTLNSTPTTPISRSICQGQSTTFNGQTITQAGTFRDTLSTSAGCDSFIVLTVTLNPTPTTPISRSICQGQSTTFNGQTITQAGTYRDTLSTSVGCDSFIVLTVTLNPVKTTSITQQICQGSSIVFNGQTITQAGVYRDTLSTSLGCDSFIVLTISVNNVLTTNQTQTVCQGQSIVFNGQTISQAGTYRDTFTTVQGCDSFVVLTLNVNPTKITNLTRVICQGASVTIGNSVFTTTGNFSVVLSSSLNCDSTVNLNLTVNPVKATLLRDTICEGDSVQVGSQTFFTAGTFVVSLVTSQDCDSIVTLNLFVNPKKSFNLSQVICLGDSVTIGTKVFKTEGTYAITLQTSKGCDSIINLNLTVLDTSINTFVTTICDGDSVTIGNQTFKVAGIYTVVLQSSFGCDSTVILDLRIKPTQTTNLTEIICQGESVTVGNLSFSTTGIFTVVLQTFQSCDSTVILDLTVNPISRSSIFEVICEGDSIIVGSQTFNATGNYTITLENAAGCDSIINLDLVVNPIATTNIVKSICRGEAEIIGNQVFTETGNYTVVLQTSSNCDSTVNLDLIVVEPVITELNFKVCQGESISVGDSIYSTTGTYSNTLNSAAGCDSIINLNLIVDPAITTPITTSICDGDSVTIGNQTFKVEGAYSVVLQSAAGCDSTVNLNLTVNSVTRTSISRSICSGDNFVVGNETFTETGEYTIVLQSALGCDSTVLLNLLVNSLPNIDAVADQPTVNIGEPVQLNVTTSETLTYNWTPADLVSNPEIQNPTAVLNESTWFYVTATNGQTQCRFTDSVFVELNELSCSKENVFIPNAFTPNGDEVNDIFIPRSSILKSMKLVVFDRWGNQVFESNDINVGWDGNYKGQPAQVDSYGYYFIGECSQGEKITIKGNVSLLR